MNQTTEYFKLKQPSDPVGCYWFDEEGYYRLSVYKAPTEKGKRIIEEGLGWKYVPIE